MERSLCASARRDLRQRRICAICGRRKDPVIDPAHGLSTMFGEIGICM
jgi:hypothetical protein